MPSLSTPMNITQASVNTFGGDLHSSFTGSLLLARTLFRSPAEQRPRVFADTQFMQGITPSAGRRLQQAAIRPDLAQHFSGRLCDKPADQFIFPRQDSENCTVDFIFNSIDNPPVDLTQQEINIVSPVLNAMAIGYSYESTSDTSVEACTYTRIADDGYVTAGHCIDDIDAGTGQVVLTQGYELANSSCLEGGSFKTFSQHDVIEPATLYDSPTTLADFGLVQRYNSSEALSSKFYPIANISTRVPEQGETVYMLGHPARLPATWKKTQVLAVVDSTHSANATNPRFKMNAFSLQGISGGPVVDTSGQVIGLVSHSKRDRLNPNDTSGLIQKGPQYIWAFAMKGFLAQSAPLRQVLAQPRLDRPERIHPKGSQFRPQCNAGILAGAAIDTALQYTQNRTYQANVTKSDVDDVPGRPVGTAFPPIATTPIAPNEFFIGGDSPAPANSTPAEPVSAQPPQPAFSAGPASAAVTGPSPASPEQNQHSDEVSASGTSPGAGSVMLAATASATVAALLL